MTVIADAIDIAVRWLDTHGIGLKARSVDAIRADYRRAIIGAMTDYVTSHDRATAYKSIYKKAATEVLPEAFYTGYADAGGDRNKVDTDADEWLTARMNQEIGFIDDLFVSLKQLRDQFWAEEITAGDLRDEVANRAEGYTATFDAVYNAGAMWGDKNQMLMWQYGDTEHCDTCQKLNGQSHKAKWYLARDYIPRKPGAAMDCGGYRCQCVLLNKDGDEVTL